jgi:hypothetical protein
MAADLRSDLPSPRAASRCPRPCCGLSADHRHDWPSGFGRHPHAEVAYDSSRSQRPSGSRRGGGRGVWRCRPPVHGRYVDEVGHQAAEPASVGPHGVPARSVATISQAEEDGTPLLRGAPQFALGLTELVAQPSLDLTALPRTWHRRSAPPGRRRTLPTASLFTVETGLLTGDFRPLPPRGGGLVLQRPRLLPQGPLVLPPGLGRGSLRLGGRALRRPNAPTAHPGTISRGTPAGVSEERRIWLSG